MLLKPDLKFRIRNCQILRNALRERANFAAATRPQAAQKTTGTARTGPKTERLTILRAATHEIELGDHDLSQPVTLY